MKTFIAYFNPSWLPPPPSKYCKVVSPLLHTFMAFMYTTRQFVFRFIKANADIKKVRLVNDWIQQVDIFVFSLLFFQSTFFV